MRDDTTYIDKEHYKLIFIFSLFDNTSPILISRRTIFTISRNKHNSQNGAMAISVSFVFSLFQHNEMT